MRRPLLGFLLAAAIWAALLMFLLRDTPRIIEAAREIRTIYLTEVERYD